jgi:hypothetical protein
VKKAIWVLNLDDTEMVEPTSALDMIVDEAFAHLRAARRYCDGFIGRMSTWILQDLQRSVISQCVFYLCSRFVINRLDATTDIRPKDIELISEQITAFSLNALKA